MRPCGMARFFFFCGHEHNTNCTQHPRVELHLHRPRAVFRRVHSSTVGHELQHLLVAATGIRHVAQREDLPQQDPERPAAVRWWRVGDEFKGRRWRRRRGNYTKSITGSDGVRGQRTRRQDAEKLEDQRQTVEDEKGGKQQEGGGREEVRSNIVTMCLFSMWRCPPWRPQVASTSLAAWRVRPSCNNLPWKHKDTHILNVRRFYAAGWRITSK